MGHARYANKAAYGRRFHDDAFITYIEPKASYNIEENLGIYLSFTYRKDKLNIETSEFYDEYFKSSTRASLNLGAQFSF